MKIYKLYTRKCFYKTCTSILVTVFALLMIIGCRKFIELNSPVNNINANNVYTNDATAASVITGIYQKMSRQNSDEFNGTGLLANMYTNTGLSADELVLFDENSLIFRPYYTNNLLSTDPPGYWASIYSTIFIINSVLEGVQNSTTLTPAVKQQIKGEAKFLRAFNYFYLVNFYGDVPLVLGTDYKTNNLLPRAPLAQVYEQVIGDLEDAMNLLNEHYVDGGLINTTTERVRPNKFAAAALLSRVYLYQGGLGDSRAWAKAEALASEVINYASLYEIVDLNDVFLGNSLEAIWQLQPVNNNINANTGEGKFFILPSEGPGVVNPIYLRMNLVNAFEANDQRKSNWVNHVTSFGTTYYYPYKYKIGAISTATAEYSTILRLAELYLIRAEARTQQNNLSGAAEDLNILRKRAGLSSITAITKADLLKAILHERRIELFTEWGHRWFDLKRTGNADAVLKTVKGANWQTTDQLLPIPQAEIQRSPSLKGHQNPGYN